MPNYTFKCSEGHQFDKVVPLVDYDKAQQCPICGRGADKQPVAPNINVPGGTPRFYR